jgi:ADP-ribose pyrophosphatase
MPDSPSSPQIIARRLIHKGRKFDYDEITVRMPSGKDVQRQMVRHPGAVVIVPILPGGEVVLVRVFRHALNRPMLECCAGTLEAGEEPALCAGRELIEETGYRAGKIQPLAAFFTSPGLSDELMHAFAATDLTHVGQQLEEDEDIQVEVLSPAELARAIDEGRIADGKSLVALMLAQRRGLVAKP